MTQAILAFSRISPLLQSAMTENRFFLASVDNSMWCKEDLPYFGIFDKDLAFLCQNKDGSFDVVLSFANGSSSSRWVRSIFFRLLDTASLQTIIECSFPCKLYIPSGRTELYRIHFDSPQAGQIDPAQRDVQYDLYVVDSAS